MNQVKLYQKVQEKKLQILDYNSKIATAELELSELYKQCSHESTEKMSRSFSGGYDYKSEDHRWDQCILCNEKFNHKVTSGYFE